MKVGYPQHVDRVHDSRLEFAKNAQDLSKTAKAELDVIKRQQEAVRIGDEIPNTRNMTSMEQLRVWSARNPKLSTTAAMASIVGLSTSLAMVSGWAIDELAHLTDRKNDKVGVVFGTLVGLALMVTQTVQLFALARRGEMRFKANAFSKDTHSAEGQSYQLIRKRNPVLERALVNNAKSEMSRSNDLVKFTNHDVYQAMNLCTREGWGKQVWEHSLEVSDRAPVDGRAYFRATTSSLTSGFEKGKFYVARHLGTNDFLDRELTEYFSSHEQLKNNLVKLLPGTGTEHEAGAAKDRLISFMGVDRQQAMEAFEKIKADHGDSFENVWQDLRKYGNETGQVSTLNEKVSQINSKYRDELDAFRKSRNSGAPTHDPGEIDPMQRLARYIAAIDKTPQGGKSWVRVDELTKIGPALMGWRTSSIHSLLQNVRDSFFSFIGSMDAVTQGRAAGNSIFSFVPFALLVSVVGVLCLGMSSTSAGGGTIGGPPTKDGHTGMGVFPFFENGKQTSNTQPTAPAVPQPQAVPNATPLTQALGGGMYAMA